MTNENSGNIETRNGFEVIIYNTVNFPEFVYFDASKKVQDGLIEHRTYLFFNNKNLNLLHRSFEDMRFPKRHHLGLNEMSKNN